MKTRNLPVLADHYLRGRVVSSEYVRNFRRVMNNCRTLSSDAINRYLHKRASKIASVTVATERAMIVGVWKWAYETGRVESPPKGIVKIKVSRRPTRAWTVEQCCTAVKGTFAVTGMVRGTNVPMSLFLRCIILLGYETGARLGDLWALRGEDFEGDAIRWSQHKTGDPHIKTLSQPCLDAVRAMLAHSPDGRVLGWAMLKSSGGRRLVQYLRTLKLSGSTKWLRRSGATHIEMAHPGKGRLHLGHRTVGLAERSYIDWSQVRRDIPCVPTLLK